MSAIEDTALTQPPETTPVSGDEVERVAAALDPWRRVWMVAFEPFDNGPGKGVGRSAEDAGVAEVLPLAWPTIGDLRAIAALHPTDPAAIRNAALEEAARVAEGLVAIARASKSHPHPLPIDTNEGWRRLEDGAQDIVDAIRGLVKEVG